VCWVVPLHFPHKKLLSGWYANVKIGMTILCYNWSKNHIGTKCRNSPKHSNMDCLKFDQLAQNWACQTSVVNSKVKQSFFDFLKSLVLHSGTAIHVHINPLWSSAKKLKQCNTSPKCPNVNYLNIEILTFK